MNEIKQNINNCLESFSRGSLKDNSLKLLKTIGYKSSRSVDVGNSPDAFIEQFDPDHKFDARKKNKTHFDNWRSIDFLFQLTDAEIKSNRSQPELDFGSSNLSYDKRNYLSYLFFALELEVKDGNKEYSRNDLSTITREINRLFSMPVMLLIYSAQMNKLTLAIINRRLNKKDDDKDVLEKVTLIKDINLRNPHRAHTDILYDLSLNSIITKYRCRNFNDLHDAWSELLNIELLNKKFYNRIAEWFFTAVQRVQFPHGGVDDEALRNRTAIIRMLTRIVFCWFAKEKGLLPAQLFDSNTPSDMLKQFDPESKKEGDYYKTFLQNLFFAVLSVPIEDREFCVGGIKRGKTPFNKDYMNHTRFRHKSLFNDINAFAKLIEKVPFLNGGLFECLDYKSEEDGKKYEIRVDGFSDRPEKQPFIPNELFFADKIIANLNDAFGSTKKSEVEVAGLFKILNDYKFTITENTPIEEEIALDPELLGRIFENLLAEYNPETEKSARKDTGSFYTPRTIVDYMVNESLKAHLKTKMIDSGFENDSNLDSGLNRLFAYTEAEHPFEDNDVVNKLVDSIYDIKVLDPACGSGAFPIGVLQKLVFVLNKLDHDHKRWKERILTDTPAEMREDTRKLLERSTAEHNWKLGLIQHSIYGVDIQPIAVQIAKLRCFISLLVDFHVDENAENLGVPPLPNLDFKFVAADTLIKPPSEINRADDLLAFEDPFFAKFATAAEDYFFARDPDKKKKLRENIEQLIEEQIETQEKRIKSESGMLHGDKKTIEALKTQNKTAIQRAEQEIELWESYRNIFAFRNDHVQFFDTPYFFPECKDGFDIVIGNPPYIQIQKFPKEKKEQWVNQKFQSFSASADIYCLFYERGAQLLAKNGYLCYITSNNWMRANYGEKLREYLSTEVETLKVFDFGMSINFTSAAALTNILLLSNRVPSNRTLCCYASDNNSAMNNPAKYFSENSVKMNGLSNDSWIIVSPERYRIKQLVENQGDPLEVWDISINYGVKTGFNDAFYIDNAKRQEIISNEPHSKDIIVPLLRGRFVDRYKTNWDETWMIATFPAFGLDINDHPILKKYLESNRSRIEPKPREFNGSKWDGRKAGSYEWFETQDPIAYYQEFYKPKIIYPNMTKWLPFYYDKNQHFFINDKGFIMTSENESIIYLTAVFNSSLFKCCFKDNFPELLGNTYELRKVFFEKIPIKKPTKEQIELFEILVDYVQFAKSADAPKDALPPCDVIAAFLEEVIDACVMEVYFYDHMKEKELNFIELVQPLLKSFSDSTSNAAKFGLISEFYRTANEPKHPIRNRLMRLTIDSPDLLAVIKEEGTV